MAIAYLGDFREALPAAVGFRLSAGAAQAHFSPTVGWELQKNGQPSPRPHSCASPPPPSPCRSAAICTDFSLPRSEP